MGKINTALFVIQEALVLVTSMISHVNHLLFFLCEMLLVECLVSRNSQYKSECLLAAIYGKDIREDYST